MAGGYYFAPMMVRYGKVIHAATWYLMSAEGRLMIANFIKFCRRFYGPQRAAEFRNALINMGAIYPQLRKRPVS
jgi:hypothetical protein